MATSIYPSLSEDGFILSSDKMMDYLMADFLATDYSQSVLHYGKIYSFGYLVSQYGNKPTDLMDYTKRSLSTYLGRYFSNVVINIEYTYPDSESSLYYLTLTGTYVKDDGSINDLSYALSIENSKFNLISTAMR